MGQVFSSFIKLWFGLVNRKPTLISPPKLDSCNDSHSEPFTESSTDCVINIDSSIQILNEEFKSFPDLDSGEEDKSCVINFDSSIQTVDNDYKSFLDLDKEEILEGCLLWEDKTISHANSYTGSNTHFVTNKDSSIPVVEKEYKSSPVLKIGEAKAGLIFGEGKANEQNLLISSLTFFTNKDSSIPVVEKEYKSSPVLKTGEKGEIHIAHKSRRFFLEGNLKSLAGTVGLQLIKELAFNYKDFEGYCTKYGLTSSTESSSQVEVPEFDTGRTEKEVKVCKEVVVVKEKWIKQYCSSHKILLVGEGDFSFSASLAVAFGSTSNMIATSLDTEGFLRKNYKRAMSNIQELKNRGCFVMHEVDATEMAGHYSLRGMRFDRIIYNFPLAGFFKDESRNSQLKRNRKLVRLFFMNAKKMISKKGEVHIAHKSCGFFLEWNLKSLAGNVGLQLINELSFNFKDFTGYCTKYGFGGDDNFDCNPSKRYIFGL